MMLFSLYIGTLYWEYKNEMKRFVKIKKTQWKLQLVSECYEGGSYI